MKTSLKYKSGMTWTHGRSFRAQFKNLVTILCPRCACVSVFNGKSWGRLVEVLFGIRERVEMKKADTLGNQPENYDY
jgi:hypothetical protein